MDCVPIQREILVDLNYRGTYVCKECNGSKSSVSEQDSCSMNSEDLYRSGYDGDINDVGMQSLDEDELLGIANENNTHSTPYDSALRAYCMGTTKLGNTDRGDQEINKGPLSIPQPVNPHQNPNYEAKGGLENKEEYNQHLTQQSMAQSGAWGSNLNPLAWKVDHLVTMIQELTQNMTQVDKEVKEQDRKNEVYMQKASDKINENIQQTLADSLASFNNNLKIGMEKEIDRQVQVRFDSQINANIQQRVDNAINDGIGQRVEDLVNVRINTLQQRFENSLNDRMVDYIEGRVESGMEEVQEKMWRKKNVLVINLPESKKSNVEERKNEDLDEVHRIFNLLIRFYDEDMECMPVRLGRIGDKPRILRVTLKSEFMAKELTQKARDQNHLINPKETDNRKKIYINRDYTFKDRDRRQRAMDEKKERESRGETNLTIRKNKVVVKGFEYKDNPKWRNQRNYTTQGQTHFDTANREMGQNHISQRQQNHNIEPLPQKQYQNDQREHRPNANQNHDQRYRLNQREQRQNDYPPINNNGNHSNRPNLAHNGQNMSMNQNGGQSNYQSSGLAHNTSQYKQRDYQHSQSNQMDYEQNQGEQRHNDYPSMNTSRQHQNSYIGTGISPMLRDRDGNRIQGAETQNQINGQNNYTKSTQSYNPTDYTGTGSSPMLRDREGNILLGAEGGVSPKRDRSSLSRDVGNSRHSHDRYENRNRTEEYNTDRFERQSRRDQYRNDRMRNRVENDVNREYNGDRQPSEHRYRRSQRQSASRYNRNQPGSIPYGAFEKRD